jgi:hypothetical protein
MRLSALRLPFLAGGESFGFVVGKARAQRRVARTIFHVVIAGHSRSKSGVASLAYDPAIHAEGGLAGSSGFV